MEESTYQHDASLERNCPSWGAPNELRCRGVEVVSNKAPALA